MIEELKKLYEQQNQIVIVVSIILSIWIISSILKNLAIILNAIEKGYFTFLKLLKALVNIILLPLKLIAKGFIYIATTNQRLAYKKQVLESPYNVYPEYFKIRWYRKIFNHKLRRDIKARFRCIEKAIETQEFINSNMKYITMIETSVGGGKSSLMAGLTHLKTLHFQEMIEEKIDNTKKILFKVDWDEVDKIIEENYYTNYNSSNIEEKITSDEKFKKLFSNYYSNYRQDTPKTTLLNDYIEAYCAKLRNNYVMANYRLFNRITETFNIDLPSNLFDIKTIEGRKNYYIPSYCVIAEDELSLTALKNTTSFLEVDKSGRDTSMRLFRQLKNETAFYIGCSQNISRNAKIFRELANTYYEIVSLDIVGTLKNYSRIFQKKENKYFKKMTKKKYINKIPSLKEKIYNAYQEQNKIYAAGFLKYTIRIALSDRDLDRFDKSSLKEQELYIPMTWCFGTYLKCQFNEFDKYLNNISKKSDGDLKIIDSFFEKEDPIIFEQLIQQKEKEKKEEKKKEQKQQ